ncbi:hydroxyethylthiazole kinase [uncultured Megasphaera sp.]|uniref:hydroxyethylthiazole kinase n=1 Tax=uncultured Megasphaera sp. TaxID=165188 RepID=UPI00259877A1|nr:hydroxyethylthiazole kinase [uncultured Megasphaera sp.]
MEIVAAIGAARHAVRTRRPLIHELTGSVTANDCANITLALGASPVMAQALPEVGEVTKKSSALLINLGMLQPTMLASLHRAAGVAVQEGIPLVLDPVGVGTTAWRTQAAIALVKAYKFTIIKGNGSEIQCLAREESGVYGGVDSLRKVLPARDVQYMAVKLGTTVAVTGAIDMVSDGKQTYMLQNGCSMLTRITGTGCMTGALAAAYSAVTTPLTAAVAAITTMSLAGEKARKQAAQAGPGSLHAALFDVVYRLTAEDLRRDGKIRSVSL